MALRQLATECSDAKRPSVDGVPSNDALRNPPSLTIPTRRSFFAAITEDAVPNSDATYSSLYCHTDGRSTRLSEHGDDDTALQHCGDRLPVARNRPGVNYNHHHHPYMYAGNMRILNQGVTHNLHCQRKDEIRDKINMYHEGLAIGQDVFGNYRDHELAIILNKLGNLYYEMGDFGTAIYVFEQGLEVERAVLHPFHPNITCTLTNMGQIHRLRGDYQAACRLYNEALSIQCQSLGPSHPTIAPTLSSIALVNYQTGSYSNALKLYQQANGILRAAFGDMNLEIASNLNSIGLVLFKMGQYDSAMQSFHESLHIRHHLLGPNHIAVANILYNTATIHLRNGNIDDAMAYYRETLRVDRVALGESHGAVVRTIQLMGQLHQQIGELENALEHYHYALNILCSSSSGEASDFTAIAQTLNSIGNVYFQGGDARRMVQVLSDAVRCLRKAGKEDDELNISGINFYYIAKMHPECAASA